MPEYRVEPKNLALLQGKVIVLTGGATGIGRSLVKQLHSLGAHVFFGDINDKAAESLIQESNNTSSSTVQFRHTDVTCYADNISLFESALCVHGHIDHAISIAGIMEQENIVSPELDFETVKVPPKSTVLDVNLLAALYFCRIAAVYLRRSNNNIAPTDRSITLFSSIAGFNDAPGMFTYAASKHGILGFMRAARSYLPVTHGIRINAVAPWFTATDMVASIRDQWIAKGLPINQPSDVAYLVTGLMSSPVANGKTIFIGGGKGWDIEEDLRLLRAQWLGSENDMAIKNTRALLGMGSSWTTSSI